MESNFLSDSFLSNSLIKIGNCNAASQMFSSKKKALNIHDFDHYKISTIKIISTSCVSSIEIQYQLLSESSEIYDNFFVDLIQGSSKLSKDSKITTYNFAPDEEIKEISGRSNVYLDQLVLKTNYDKNIIAGGEGGNEFKYKAPIGYCYKLFRCGTFKEFIESLEIEMEVSSVSRFKIYKTIEQNMKDTFFSNFENMENKIVVDENLFRNRFDFEKEANELYSYKTMRNELEVIARLDKLGFMRYYLKYLYLDKKNSSESNDFTQNVLKTLKVIYKLLKYPRLLFNEKDENDNLIKIEEIIDSRKKLLSKTHPAFKNIFNLLIIVKCLLESPAPYDKSFTYLKTILLNIHDLYVSFLITLINFNISGQEEAIKNLLKPPINLYGHHLGFYIVSEDLAKSFLSSTKNSFKINQLSFKRINSQDIYYFERQVLVHCFNRKLFNLESIPSTLLGVRQFKQTKVEKPNESFFILSYEPNDLVNVKPLINLNHDEIRSMCDISFANQLISSIFCSPIESISASYIFETNKKELIRIPTWNDPNLESRASMQEDALLRNPLYVIDLPQILQPINSQLLVQFKEMPLEQLFVEFLAWIKLETFLISFEYFKYDVKSNESPLLKKREKVPVYSLADETVTFLYLSAINNLAFIKDNPHLKLIDILFHLNPVLSLCQEQLLKHFPDHEIRLKQISRFDYDVIFSRSKMDIKKLCRPKIRKYTEKMKKFNNTPGQFPIHRTVTNWLKVIPLNKMENLRLETFLQGMLSCLPLANNHEIYSHWNSFLDWKILTPFYFRNPQIVDFLLDLPVNLKEFKFRTISPHQNLLDLITNEEEKMIYDPNILELYIKKGGFNPDEGYPFILTPFERAIGKESHSLIKKMLELGAGKKANPDNLKTYVLKFYEYDDFELLNKEKVRESIRFNYMNIIEMHPVLKWKLVLELMKKKPAVEEISTYISLISCENEELYIQKSKIEKCEGQSNSFIYHFSHKDITFDLFFDNEPKFHGLHLAITSLMIKMMGSEACVIPTKFLKDSENNCFEVKEYFSLDRKVYNSSLNEYNQLTYLNFEGICERVIMNIVLLPGEVRPEDEIVFCENNGKIKIVPWDFSKQFVNHYLRDEPKSQKDFIKTISYLFCLDEMNLPISLELRARIVFVDIYKVLDEWLHELSNLHWKLSYFRKGTKKIEGEYLGVLFKKNMISLMAFRFLKIQNLLNYKDKITLNEIFKYSDPEIFHIYECLQGNCWKDRYIDLLKLAEKDLNSFKYSEYSIYLQIKSRISKGIMAVFKQEDLIGPEEALLEMKMIREGFTKEKIAMNCIDFQKIQDFDLILFALRSLDFKDTTKELQGIWVNEGLIKAFEKQVNSYTEKAMSLKLKNMNFLTLPTLEKMPLLKQIKCLILQGCCLSEEIIVKLAYECPLLESLDLSFNDSLKNFDENISSFNFFSNPKLGVFFQSLKHLNLECCENLLTVHLQADLETICLKNCKKLTFFHIEPISLSLSLDYVDFQGVVSYPEKEFSKIISKNFFEIRLDERTCQGAFANVLKEFPTYPRIPAYTNIKKPDVRIPAKLLDYIFPVLGRKENNHLLECLSMKDMTEVELAKLCNEINKGLPSRNLVIKYVDLSNNKGINFAANIAMMKTVVSGGLPMVEILNLSQINFGNNIFLKLFAEWLKLNKIIKKLILDEASIKNEDLVIILDAVNKKNSILESLSLRKNGFNSIGFETISSFLEGNASLKNLDLSYNNLDEKSIKLLFKSLTYNKSLLSLTLKARNPKKIENFEENQEFLITDESIDDVRDSLNNNHVLQEIDLRNHPISPEKADSLYKILHLSTNLHSIKLKNTIYLNKRKTLEKINQKVFYDNSYQLEISNFLNKSNISAHRANSFFIDKSQRNILPDTWVFGLGIDGGGMRGIIPSILIEFLVKHTKCQIHEMFDYIGGSSIGGILALGCAGTLDGVNPICPADECVNIFSSYGKVIFGKKKNKYDPLGIMENKYNDCGLESVVKNYFKNSFLSETLTNVLVTSVNKDNNEMMIFDSRKAFRDPDNDFFMRNVARATSAAPTFFSAARFHNLTGSKFYSLIDGGVGKNDPTYFVFEGVKSIADNYGIPQKFSVISLGTGEIADQKTLPVYAGVKEVKNLLSKCIDTHTELDQAIFKEKYGNVKYRRFQSLLKLGKNQDISLDNTDPEVVKTYKESAYSLAEDFLIENFGEFQNISLVDWLAENTARKKELI